MHTRNRLLAQSGASPHNQSPLHRLRRLVNRRANRLYLQRQRPPVSRQRRVFLKSVNTATQFSATCVPPNEIARLNFDCDNRNHKKNKTDKKMIIECQ